MLTRTYLTRGSVCIASPAISRVGYPDNMRKRTSFPVSSDNSEAEPINGRSSFSWLFKGFAGMQGADS